MKLTIEKASFKKISLDKISDALQKGLSRNFKEVIVEMRRLDDVKIVNKIGFIKIDVEGHELEVIDGAKNTIINNMPVLLVEIEKRHTKEPVEKSINHIKKIGYECFFVKNKELILTDQLKDKQLENNYYFLPRNFKQDL